MPGSQSVGALSQTAAIRQRLLNYLQRLFLDLRFDASPADSFSSFKAPVETFTTPELLLSSNYMIFSDLCQYLFLYLLLRTQNSAQQSLFCFLFNKDFSL